MAKVRNGFNFSQLLANQSSSSKKATTGKKRIFDVISGLCHLLNTSGAFGFLWSMWEDYFSTQKIVKGERLLLATRTFFLKNESH